MRDRFRVDAQVLGEECSLGTLTIYGETLEDAMVSVLGLLTPHIHEGAAVQILGTGVFCDECRAYHPCTDRLLQKHSADEVEAEEAPPLPAPPNGFN